MSNLISANEALACTHRKKSLFFFASTLILFGGSLFGFAADSDHFTAPVTYYKLPNGLRVVLSRDSTAPTVVVAVYYRIGFRVEPRDRSGFAHLFEHMMFQGSRNLGKMEFIKLVQQNGGILNGSTRFDFTNYFELLPSNKLETALWAESDRMKGLAITEDNLKNQQGVVENEVKVNVINAPYGGFPWLWIPQYANTNWYNSHNFYGDMKDLEAAKLEDVQQFFKTYYAPNNAALVSCRRFRARSRQKDDCEIFSADSRREVAASARSDGAAPNSAENGRSQGPSRKPAGSRNCVSHAAAEHSGILRDGTSRSDVDTRR